MTGLSHPLSVHSLPSSVCTRLPGDSASARREWHVSTVTTTLVPSSPRAQ